jgi:TP901 family phage tail tape measure protein
MAFKKIKEVIEVAVKGGGAANRSLSNLDKAQDKASKSANNLEKKDRHLAKAARHLAKALDQTTAAQTRSDKAKQKSAKEATRLQKSIRGLGEAFKVAGGAAQAFSGVSAVVSGLGRTLAKPLGVAVSFEREFAMVKTLTDQAGVDLKKGLIDLAQKLPFSVSSITKSAYSAISAGIKAPDVVSFLDAASKAAIGTGSDLNSTVMLLTAAVNAFGHQGETAATIADKMQMTIKNAVLSGQDLQSIFGMLAPSASLGASIDEVLALTGALTKIGIKPHMAAVRVNAMIKELTRTSGHAAKAFKRLGIETGVTAIKNKGLTAILQEVQDKTRGSAAEIKKLSNNIRATGGFLGILGHNFSEFMYQVEANQDSAGAHVRAAEIVGNTAQGAINKFRATVDVVMQKLGEELLPEINKFMERLTNWLEANQGKIKEAFVDTIELFFRLGNWVVSNGDAIVSALTGIANAGVNAIKFMSEAASNARKLISFAIPGSGGGVSDLIDKAIKAQKAAEKKAGSNNRSESKKESDKYARSMGFSSSEELESAETDFRSGFYVVLNQTLRDASGRVRKEQLYSKERLFKNFETSKAIQIVQENLQAISDEIGRLESSKEAIEARRLIKSSEKEVADAKANREALSKKDASQQELENSSIRLKHAIENLEINKKQARVLARIAHLEKTQKTTQAEFVKPLASELDKIRIAGMPALKAGPSEKDKKAADRIAKMNREIEQMHATAAANMGRLTGDGKVLSNEADMLTKMNALAARQFKILGDYQSKGAAKEDILKLGDAFEMQMDFLQRSETAKANEQAAKLEEKRRKELERGEAKQRRMTRGQALYFAGLEGNREQLEQTFQLEDQYKKERELFRGHKDALILVEQEYQRKQAALIKSNAALSTRIQAENNANIVNTLGSTISSIEAAAEAVGASQGVMQGIQAALFLSRGAYHTFMGFSELANAASAAVGGPQTLFRQRPDLAIAHKFAAASHFIAAGSAAVQAGAAVSGGMSSGGGGGGSASLPPRQGVNDSRSALSAMERDRGPAISFGDIVLSDVPALLSKSGSKALGAQIAGHVAQELGRRSNIQGTVRINQRAVRRG